MQLSYHARHLCCGARLHGHGKLPDCDTFLSKGRYATGVFVLGQTEVVDFRGTL